MTGQRVTDDIEITPEMIEAGASILCHFQTETAGEDYWAEEVYKAMASRKPHRSNPWFPHLFAKFLIANKLC